MSKLGLCKTREMKRRKAGKALAGAKLFSGVLHMVALSFPNGVAVAQSDLFTAMQYLLKSTPIPLPPNNVGESIPLNVES